MKRYHKEVFFPEQYLGKLEILTEELNTKDWKFTKHCLDNLMYRAIDMENLLKHIKESELNPNDIFEFYMLDEEVNKVCYRVAYDIYDYILVLNKDKTIITIFINSKEDKHQGLDKKIYSLV